ncbi:MAG: transposase [Kiritimatiellae bacterium]|nr:transposase [Kiritimatiellia bacterium]
MKPDAVYIGVDVSKAKLDVFVPAQKEGMRPTAKELDNDVAGLRELRDLARKAGATVCVEPTGGYELELIAFMHKSGVPVAYADALRVRQFARAEGCLSKNDSIDAALISRFADKIGVRALEEKDVEAVELKRRAKFRQTMSESRTVMINRLETEVDPDMKALLREQIRRMNKLIAKAERLCLATARKNERTNTLCERFTQVGGVGAVTAVSILAGLPEIGTLPDEKLNRLVGISPEENQSGSKDRFRRIRGGRQDVRNALYMAATASLIWNSVLGAYYRKKRAEGHPHKWAMVPTMRKLLSLLNRIARDPSFAPRPEPESTKRNAKVGRRRKAA